VLILFTPETVPLPSSFSVSSGSLVLTHPSVVPLFQPNFLRHLLVGLSLVLLFLFEDFGVPCPSRGCLRVYFLFPVRFPALSVWSRRAIAENLPTFQHPVSGLVATPSPRFHNSFVFFFAGRFLSLFHRGLWAGFISAHLCWQGHAGRNFRCC